MAVTVPSDKRFRRTRSRPVQHTRLRSRWWWHLLRSTVTLGGLAWAGYEAALMAVDAPALRVQHIAIEGNVRLSIGEATALLDGLKGENLLLTNLERWRERLQASSWVADAVLRRKLPSTVEIRIVEREPIGIARLRDELYLVDDSGGVIDEFGPRYADCDLPIIDGLLVADNRGARVDPARSHLVTGLMADLRRRPDVARRVSQIDVADLHDLHVILDEDPTVVRLGETRFLERIWSYVELQASLRQRVPAIDYVDLRFDNRVYVGPSHAVAAASDANPPRDAAARQ
jgi:cell division septal protein FtsQ